MAKPLAGNALEAAQRLFFGDGIEIGRKPKRGLRALPASATPRKPQPHADQAAIRSRLGSIQRRVPEAMVKISGAGRCMGQIRAHLSYISRNGQIELEDQDGQKMNGREGLRDVREDWQSGFPIPEDRAVTEAGEDGQGPGLKGRREAFNLVLSMPAGTSEVALKRAVRSFAADEFAGHQYVMALHTEATDPDPKPSPHPHVHLTVKARSLTGLRLNPRKADLQRWREQFAACLRDNGIEAVATKRQVRLQREPGQHQRVRQMIERGGSPGRAQRRMPEADAVARNGATRDRVVADWSAVVGALALSGDREDLNLSVSLRKQLGLRVAEAGRDAPDRGLDPSSEKDKGPERSF